MGTWEEYVAAKYFRGSCRRCQRVTSSNICVNPKQRFGMLEQTAVSVSGMLVRDKVISAFGYMLGTCLGVYA